MAAAYAFHIVMNHPFDDGNKRTGFQAALVFLISNGYELVIPGQDAYTLVSACAKGRSPRKQLATALRQGSVAL